MSLDQKLKELEQLNQKASQKRSQVDDTDNEIQANLQDIRQSILNGQSTGDKITDFVLVSYSNPTSDLKKPYRELEKKLKDQKSSLVLVQIKTAQKKESGHKIYLGHVDHCLPPPDNSYTEITNYLRLGVLTGDLDFDFADRKIIIPTDKHVSSQYSWRDEFIGDPRIETFTKNSDLELGWDPQEQPIIIDPNGLSKFGPVIMPDFIADSFTDLLSPFLSLGIRSRELTVFTGDEVEQYFNNRAATSYVEALNLLGLRAPIAFQRKYDQKIKSKRENVLKNLDDLILKEQSLENEIENIEHQIRAKGDIYYEGEPQDGEPGYTYTVAQQIRDKTSDQKKGLEYLYKKIKSHVQEALELGLDKTDMVLQKRPGVKIIVGEYISGLAQKYEVAVPK